MIDMVSTPTNVKPLAEFLRENKIDSKKIHKVLQKYLDEHCVSFLGDNVNFEMWCYRNAIDDFKSLIKETDNVIEV